jgi:hypothetical protein
VLKRDGLCSLGNILDMRDRESGPCLFVHGKRHCIGMEDSMNVVDAAVGVVDDDDDEELPSCAKWNIIAPHRNRRVLSFPSPRATC